MVRFYTIAALLCWGLVLAHACTPTQQQAIRSANQDLDKLCAAKAQYKLSAAGASSVPAYAGAAGQ